MKAKTREYVRRIQTLRALNQDIKHYQEMMEKHLTKIIELQAKREELLKE